MRTKKGEGVKCRLVAQELGYGQRLDELFAGTPSLGAVRMALVHAMRHPSYKIMVMDVKCAFLYGEARCNIYIELPHTDPRHGDGTLLGKLRKAMYGTRDAPQIWADHVRATLENLGYLQSSYQSAVYSHPKKSVVIVAHVDDFLCTGDASELEELYAHLSETLELKKKVLSLEDDRETTYLNRILQVSEEGVKMIGDPKHSALLFKDWDIQEYSKEVGTPCTRELEDQIGLGEVLPTDLASR